ncbi:hypothetical protein HMPREF1624_07455 [Sporothrix schenckii ATCC 58251]|uniref:Transcriptional coactivator p15 (PC4) C-terminal domain-containing protein n=1 Tax=Sporothrix schenckii (strain ATCC 58251 / de Perez 2211183) TaxID=1391915 RepID=U7PLY9_SPOS1|nr:hypothetical protein HMPREF1624_07455 [Sporothrix schenckii ATCC 58251]
MADRKRAYPDADEGAGKLAKKTSGSDVAASKAKKKSSSAGGVPPKGQDQEGNVYWELSKMRRIGIAHFRSATLINIREYYESGGQMRPGKKGISLSLDQFKALIRAIPDINAELQRDGVAVSDVENDDDAARGAGKGEGASVSLSVAAPRKDKAKAPKKANIEATSDEDSS